MAANELFTIFCTHIYCIFGNMFGLLMFSFVLFSVTYNVDVEFFCKQVLKVIKTLKGRRTPKRRRNIQHLRLSTIHYPPRNKNKNRKIITKQKLVVSVQNHIRCLESAKNPTIIVGFLFFKTKT